MIAARMRAARCGALVGSDTQPLWPKVNDRQSTQDDGTGDIGSGEHRRASVPCAQIAIVQIVALDACNRPTAVLQTAQLHAAKLPLNE
jgi:hypothetical protein